MSIVQNKRHLALGSLVSLVTLVLALVGGELVIRALGLAPEVFPVQAGRYRLSDNPLVGYEPVPHYAARGTGPMQDFPERSNSLGFRDRDHDVAKPAGTYRILVLGDSIVQGMAIADRERMFTTEMENLLRADGHAVEVLNFGVNGYNTRQEVETLRSKGLAYAPDLVILAYCLNDGFLDSGGILTNLRRKEEGRPELKLNPRLAGSHLYRLVYAVRLARATPTPAPVAIPQDRSERLVPDALADLHDLARVHGFAVLVVGFPFLDVLPDRTDPQLFADVRSWAQKHRFGFLDLTDALAAAGRGGRIHVDPLHPNERGAHFVAQALAQAVQAHYLP